MEKDFVGIGFPYCCKVAGFPFYDPVYFILNKLVGVLSRVFPWEFHDVFPHILNDTGDLWVGFCQFFETFFNKGFFFLVLFMNQCIFLWDAALHESDDVSVVDCCRAGGFEFILNIYVWDFHFLFFAIVSIFAYTEFFNDVGIFPLVRIKECF